VTMPENRRHPTRKTLHFRDRFYAMGESMIPTNLRSEFFLAYDEAPRSGIGANRCGCRESRRSTPFRFDGESQLVSASLQVADTRVKSLE
jgi:hypothetical protein